MTDVLPRLPSSNLLLGSMTDFQRDPLGTLARARELGDLVRIRLGPTQALIASHPELVHQVLVVQAGSFHKSDRLKQILGDVLGDGLLTSDGEFWRRQRSMVQPAFHARRVQTYGETIVDQTMRMLESWRSRETVQIHQEMMRLTLGIVARTLFDASLEDTEFEQVARAMETVQEQGNLRFARIFDLPHWIPTREHRQGTAAVQSLDEIVMDMIDARRRETRDRGDLLSMLLLAEDDRGQRMSDRQVHDEAMTLFLAGHETTAIALTWLWTLLARHQEVEKGLRAQINAELSGAPPAVGDLENLPLTEMVLNEVMRLYPPAWVFSRQAVEDVSLDGAQVRKDQVVLISPHAIHRDPRWYPKPEAFDPQRFLQGISRARPRYAFIPFGGGPRICIGNSFAMLEGRLVMAAVLSQCKLRLQPPADLATEPLITLRPARPISMRIEWD